MNARPSTRLFDVQQAARRLGVCPTTVRRKIARGELEALRVGRAGGIRIRESSLDRLLVPYHPSKETR